MAVLICHTQGSKKDATVSLDEVLLRYATEETECLRRQRKAAIFYPDRPIVVCLSVYSDSVPSSRSWKLYLQRALKFLLGNAQPAFHLIFRNVRFSEDTP